MAQEKNLDIRLFKGACSGVGCESVAAFSRCGKYRYFLQRQWSDTGAGVLLFLMLNPSNANERKNDPTAHACQNRARALGYGGFAVCNLFARVTPDPNQLWVKDAAERIGPDNDKVLLEKFRTHGKALCAWGNKGRHYRERVERVEEVGKMMAREKSAAWCICTNASGHPIHPRRAQIEKIPLNQELREFRFTPPI